MVSFTLSSQKPDPMRWLLGVWLMLLSGLALSEGIHILSAELDPQDGQYHLAANFEIDLTPTLEEALNKGVALHFEVEFELIRPRWYTLYLWNGEIASFRQQYRLTYNALTRQYRLTFGGLYQNFDTLNEALAVLGRVRRLHVFDDEDLVPERVYDAQIRMRLDTTLLPKPFQINAIGSRDWTLASNWYRWTLSR
jgi:hypothetical protein